VVATRQRDHESIHELKIRLAGSRPPIWRRVAVPSDATLAELHEIVQIAMGWLDCHLHQFRLKTGAQRPAAREVRQLMFAGKWDEVARLMRVDRTFTDLRVEDMDGEDERRFTISELCPQPKNKIIYEYDFGDGWEHTITVEKVHLPQESIRCPVCLKGKRACPPEDCGGIWGYYDMLEAVADPKHSEHATWRGWLPEDFDPEAFDLEEVNAMLATWRRHRRRRRSGSTAGCPRS
jgi:hypothetical protein